MKDEMSLEVQGEKAAGGDGAGEGASAEGEGEVTVFSGYSAYEEEVHTGSLPPTASISVVWILFPPFLPPSLSLY